MQNLQIDINISDKFLTYFHKLPTKCAAILDKFQQKRRMSDCYETFHLMSATTVDLLLRPLLRVNPVILIFSHLILSFETFNKYVLRGPRMTEK